MHTPFFVFLSTSDTNNKSQKSILNTNKNIHRHHHHHHTVILMEFFSRTDVDLIKSKRCVCVGGYLIKLKKLMKTIQHFYDDIDDKDDYMDFDQTNIFINFQSQQKQERNKLYGGVGFESIHSNSYGVCGSLILKDIERACHTIYTKSMMSKESHQNLFFCE